MKHVVANSKTKQGLNVLFENDHALNDLSGLAANAGSNGINVSTRFIITQHEPNAVLVSGSRKFGTIGNLPAYSHFVE
jgi:hypothetical protein